MMLLLRLLVALALLVAIVAAITMVRVSKRVATAEEAYPPEGQFVEVDGHPIHYVQTGSGPDLVLLHGASGNTRDMTFSLVDQLSDRFRVTVFDRPGLGHTPRLAASGVTLEDQADLLVAASQQLGLARPVVAGQSFGGAVTMAWAVHHPDTLSAAVSIAGATYPWPGDLDAFYATLARPVIGPVMSRLLGAFVTEDYVRNAIEGVFAPNTQPDGYADYIGVPLVLRPRSLLANAQQRTELREHLRALSPRYPELTLPIEVIHGDADDTVAISIHSEELARNVESAQLTRLPGIGHMPHHAAEAAVVEAIDRAADRAGIR
ncbi:alpha/beta fold hydrolase [Pseudooceanicola atlanticus]|uniref:Alpha/beta hydrolase n=1 Tax=Pseudooceanicola atlanticus TaxID=1461694 RepID=A0A0A0ECV5_9RHOB|nr:alpha/beta hydrolase [Pseudooceanicola atlanticus]KGM47893.1 alpha/beta hydrolase [Pseudooceanicola atlanticus]